MTTPDPFDCNGDVPALIDEQLRRAAMAVFARMGRPTLLAVELLARLHLHDDKDMTDDERELVRWVVSCADGDDRVASAVARARLLKTLDDNPTGALSDEVLATLGEQLSNDLGVPLVVTRGRRG